MCGIAGWYARGGRTVPEGTIGAMCDTIVHRGPDDQGRLTDGDFGFGMRRPAIVDVAGGHQPMTSEDGRHVVTFNGEIFNHPALRRELEALGHRYRTNSDTESILRGFQQWGPGVWAKLEGMFAVAIWDRTTRTLHLARDPLGIKPLHLTLQDGGLAAWVGTRTCPGLELHARSGGHGPVLRVRARAGATHHLSRGHQARARLRTGTGPRGRAAHHALLALRVQAVCGDARA